TGYRPIGLDHFARPDDPLSIAADADALHRNFQGYTTDDAIALIGLGASAIGSLPQGYVQNDPDIRAYHAAVSEDRLATRRGVPLSPDDRLRRAIITDLMCHFEVDLGPYSETFRDQATPSLDDFIEDEMVEMSDRTLRITERGKPFVRSVCARFDTYLTRDRARHSTAV
ncbi:MAG: coproporphyrinogen III oxidase, partial [Pseudomonadota bacterium]